MALRSGRVGIHPSQVDPITGMLLNGPAPGSISFEDLADAQISNPEVGQTLIYNGEGWENEFSSVSPTTLAALQDVQITDPADGDLLSFEAGEWVNIEDNTNDVTTLAVDLQNWSSDTTSQSGSTLYKKTLSLNNVYVESPSVNIGAGTGYVLPTLAEQASYDLLQYVTVDIAIPCLYLYASAIPTTAFYISVKGVD